jgi:tetratricopeptide (TPR) repeat protein
MSAGHNLSPTTPAALTDALPAAEGAVAERMATALQLLPSPEVGPEGSARQQISMLEREARALGSDPAAALLFHEIGLLWEDALHNPRNAAVAYQHAYKLAPRFLANIRAARRLFSDVGNWQMVVQLLDAELAATEDPNRRATLLLEKGSVLARHLSREQEAFAAFEQCLRLAPQDVSLLLQLESIYSAGKHYSALALIYRLLAGTVKDAPLQGYYLRAAGHLLEEHLESPGEAASTFEEAFRLTPGDPVLLAAMARRAERDGRTEALIAVLDAQARVEGAAASGHYIRIHRLYRKLGRRDEAMSALLSGRSACPDDPVVLSELAAIYEAEADKEKLADVLLSRAKLITEETEFAMVNLRLASLYEHLKREEDAIGRYRAVLEKVPHHFSALANLGKLYYRTQNWQGLVSVFEQEAEANQDPRQKAARVYKAAEILEKRLGQEAEAISRYQRCLQLQPGYLPAQHALTRLYEGSARFEDLLSMYEQETLQTRDREEVIAILHKMANLCEERLSDLDRAIDCIKRALELAPDHLPSIRELGRMYEYAGRWRELVQMLESEAAAATDLKQVLSLHHRISEILEEQLKDRAGAIAAYERLIALSPTYLPALKALGRLYAEGGAWLELIKMYRAEAEMATSPEQAAALLFKVGELYERELGDQRAAITAYDEVLTLSPKYLPALQALEEIFRSNGEHEKLIEVLRAEAANRTQPGDRANALVAAASIWEDMNRPEQAISVYQEVLRLAPGHALASRALERLYTSKDDVHELVAVLSLEAQTAEAPRAKVAAYLKLAQLYLERLREPARAATACEAALVLEPGNLSGLKLLERATLGDRAKRAELRARLAERTADARVAAALKASDFAETEASENGAVISALKAAFAQDPSDLRLALLLERGLRRAQDYPALFQFHEKMLERTSDPLEQLGHLFRLGDLAERKICDPQKALATYQKALQLNPQLVPALQGVRRVSLQLGDYLTARDALETEGRASRDPRSAVEAFVAAGRLAAEKLNHPQSAIENFRRALERDPLNPAAARGLKQLLSAENAPELAALHERLGEAKLAQKDLASASADFLLAAQTWLERVQDQAKALRAVERSLAAQPINPDALVLKGSLALLAKQFGEAAAAFSARVQLGGDPQTLLPIHLKLAALYQDHLFDTTRAAAHLQSVLSADSGNPEGLERLSAIHSASGNWGEAAECLKRLLETDAAPATLARCALALARVYDEGFHNPGLASSLYRRALDLAPGDLWVLGRLVDLYGRLGNSTELVQMLEQQAQGGGDAKRNAALRVKIGDVYAGSLADPPKAIENYRKAIELDPSCFPARVALANLFMRDAASAPSAIDAHGQLLRLDPCRVESIRALFRLWQGLGHRDKAFCAAAVLHFLQAANEIEKEHYLSERGRLPSGPLPSGPEELKSLIHPDARTPLVEVLRAIGDQLSKLYPAALSSVGTRRIERLRSEHPVSTLLRSIADALGVAQYEAYQTNRGSVMLETSDPLAICISQEVLEKLTPAEQRFALGRAMFGILQKSAIVHKLHRRDLENLLGSAIRIFAPQSRWLGKPDEGQTRQLNKALSRRARKALEAAVQSLAAQAKAPDLEQVLDGLTFSEDRAGLLLSGDVSVALSLVPRQDSPAGGTPPDQATDEIVHAILRQPRLEQLLRFALSDEHFELRQKLTMCL